MPRKVVIVNPINDAEKIEFTTFRLPAEYPEYEWNVNFVEESFTRRTSTSGGRRVFNPGGTNLANHGNFVTTLHLVSPSELALLQGWYAAPTPVVKLSNDGVNFYWAVFNPGGCQPSGYRHNENFTFAEPWHVKVDVNLSLVTTATAPP